MDVLVSTKLLVRNWVPPTRQQKVVRDDLLAMLDIDAETVWREGRPTHVTASVVVLDERDQQVLLVHHARSGRWQFPGGHCERTDVSLEAAARREVLEETGHQQLSLAGIIFLELGPAICRPGVRQHLDVRFLAHAPLNEPELSRESVAVGWFPVEELPSPHTPDVSELVDLATCRILTDGQ
jgi:8-oxo-dGTP pyrophosphatase MutT (NUDIX family)